MEVGGKHALEGAPAWMDEDDAAEVVVAAGTSRAKHRSEKRQRVMTGDDYQDKIREAFEDVHPTPKWAAIPTAESDSASDILLSTTSLVASTSSILRKGELEERKLRHVNSASRAEGGAHSVQFHNNGELVLVGGKKVKLFQLDFKKNPCIQHVECHKRFRLEKAQFTPDGKEIILSGNKPWLFVYDLVGGDITKVHRFMDLGKERESYRKTFVSPDNSTIAIVGSTGHIHLVSNRTRKYIASLKTNEDVDSITFSPNSQYIWSVGGGGSVYQWDVGMRKCVRRLHDEGSNHGTVVGISPDASRFGFGSSNGIVNVYDSSALQEGPRPTPLKAISSLRTSVNNAKFNADGQLLAISSGDLLEGAVKMVHVPSLTVYPRWPLRNLTGKVTCLDFSPGSDYIAVGTTKGTAHLWNLKHYAQV